MNEKGKQDIMDAFTNINLHCLALISSDAERRLDNIVREF